jgi:hypothetical protein
MQKSHPKRPQCSNHQSAATSLALGSGGLTSPPSPA